MLFCDLHSKDTELLVAEFMTGGQIIDGQLVDGRGRPA